MDFSSDALFAGLVVGSLGMGLFMYGKRQERFPQLIGGLALMMYPYFVNGTGHVLMIGVAIVAGVALAVGAGY